MCGLIDLGCGAGWRGDGLPFGATYSFDATGHSSMGIRKIGRDTDVSTLIENSAVNLPCPPLTYWLQL